MGQIILSILPVTMKSPVVSGDEEEDHDGDDSMTMMTTVRTLSLAPITITLLLLPGAGFLRILRPAYNWSPSKTVTWCYNLAYHTCINSVALGNAPSNSVSTSDEEEDNKPTNQHPAKVLHKSAASEP